MEVILRLFGSHFTKMSTTLRVWSSGSASEEILENKGMQKSLDKFVEVIFFTFNTVYCFSCISFACQIC